MYIVRDLETAIDLMAYLYPKEVADYSSVAKRIREQTNLDEVVESDIRNYYESDLYQSQKGDLGTVPKTP